MNQLKLAYSVLEEGMGDGGSAVSLSRDQIARTHLLNCRGTDLPFFSDPPFMFLGGFLLLCHFFSPLRHCPSSVMSCRIAGQATATPKKCHLE